MESANRPRTSPHEPPAGQERLVPRPQSASHGPGALALWYRVPCIVGHRLSRQGLESGLVYLVSLVDVYTPTPADLNRCLRTRVFYADNLDVGQQATGVSEVPVERLQVHGLGPIPTVNAAPVFPHQDPLTEGDQSDSTSRTVPENTRARQNIGAPITAIDADEKDLLVYTMSGADARYFRIVRTPAS